MQTKFSLLAQSRSPGESDSYVYENEPITLDDNRTLAVENLISEVTRNGHRYKVSKEVEFFIWRNRFVIYVRPVERDTSGRGAPIACHGEINIFQPTTTFVEDVEGTISEFCGRLQRTIEKSSHTAIRTAASDIKKKFIHSVRLLGVILFIGLMTLALLLKRLFL